jgi:hypothetical protein
MERFIKQTRVTKDKPVLLLLDNQSLHCIKVLELANENREAMSIVCNNSQKLQPIDRSVYGSEVILGKLTIYDIPFVLSQSLPDALMPKMIKSRLSLTGIWPFNSDIFTVEDFFPSA